MVLLTVKKNGDSVCKVRRFYLIITLYLLLESIAPFLIRFFLGPGPCVTPMFSSLLQSRVQHLTSPFMPVTSRVKDEEMNLNPVWSKSAC